MHIADQLQEVIRRSGQNLLECLQCGRCTASCPISSSTVGGPRRLIAQILCGMREDALRELLEQQAEESEDYDGTPYLFSGCHALPMPARNPRLARGDQIVAVPTLVRKLPVPVRKIIGDLSNKERVLVGLDLRPR